MELWSDLYSARHLIDRQFYGTPGSTTITAPAKAAFIRVSLVGAGGWANGGFGGGAAFARVKTTCAPGDQFSLQIGDTAHTLGAGDASGDSLLKTTPGNVVLVKAERGKGTGPGLAANSTGDIKRDGSAAGVSQGGACAGDDADPVPLGFGGRGGKSLMGPVPGGGGGKNYVEYAGSGGFQFLWTIVPGNGRACVEFFDQDPGYA
jgi:hypothetical protein